MLGHPAMVGWAELVEKKGKIHTYTEKNLFIEIQFDILYFYVAILTVGPGHCW